MRLTSRLLVRSAPSWLTGWQGYLTSTGRPPGWFVPFLPTQRHGYTSRGASGNEGSSKWFATQTAWSHSTAVSRARLLIVVGTSPALLALRLASQRSADGQIPVRSRAAFPLGRIFRVAPSSSGRYMFDLG